MKRLCMFVSMLTFCTFYILSANAEITRTLSINCEQNQFQQEDVLTFSVNLSDAGNLTGYEIYIPFDITHFEYVPDSITNIGTAVENNWYFDKSCQNGMLYIAAASTNGLSNTPVILCYFKLKVIAAPETAVDLSFSNSTNTDTVLTCQTTEMTADQTGWNGEVDDLPVSVNDAYSTNEDTLLNGTSVLTNDEAADVSEFPPLTAVVVTGPEHASSFTLNEDGTFTYLPALNYNGTDSFTYLAHEGSYSSAIATVTINIAAVNDAPVAIDDPSAGTLLNGSFEDSLNHWESIIPVGGTIDIVPSASGKNPVNGNSFALLKTDGPGSYTSLWQSVALNAGEVIQGYAFFEANDYWPYDDNCQVNIRQNSIEGTILATVFQSSVVAVGDWGQTPWTHWSFIAPANGTYVVQACIANLGDAIEDSFMGVDGISSDNYPTFEDTPLIIPAPGVLANDSDVEGSPLSAIIAEGPENGTVVLNSDGSFTYTPDTNYYGNDSFTYKANDGELDSNIATVSISVSPINDAPTITLGTAPTVLEDSGAYSVSAWATGIATGPANEAGQLMSINTINNNNALFASQPVVSLAGALTFTPAADANGSSLVTVVLQDNGGTAGGGDNSTTVDFTITVTAVNDVPVFTKGQDVTVLEDAVAYSAPWATGISAGPVDESGQVLTFSVTNSNNALFAVQPAVAPDGTLTFTPTANANGTAIVFVKLSDNGGIAGGGDDESDSQTFNIDVTAVNDVPYFTKGADVTVLEDSVAYSNAWATSISEGQPNESVQNLTFEVTPTDPSLFAVQPAIAEDGALTFTPAANNNGSTVVTVVLKDDGDTLNGGVNTSAAQIFNINITAVNDVPSFAVGSDVTVLEDSVAYSVAQAGSISAGPTDEFGQILTFNVINDNNELFSSQPAIAANGTLTFTPTANAYGSAEVTVILTDNGGVAWGGDDESDSQTFNINVTAVNDVPYFTKGADVTVLEDSIAYSNAWATNISEGQPNELAQVLTFQISAVNTSLFTVQPAIAEDGALTFTPKANANGSTVVTIVLKDDGGIENDGVDTSAEQSFTINITAVNDVPSFVRGNDEIVAEDSGAKIISAWATDILAGPVNEAAQILTFIVTTTNNTLFSAQPAIAADGTLTFTPAADANGTATVTVKLQDNGGVENGGDNESDPQTFTITVTAVNDVPSFTVGSPVTVAEDSGAYSAAQAGNISAGPANESGQTLSFTVTNDNGALFSVAPAISPTGILTFTPALNAHGMATVTVVLKDNGGMPGVDTTVAQTFSIEVTAVNDNPVAVDDTATTDEDTDASGDVLTNDSDVDSAVDGDVLTVAVAANPTHGAVVLNSNGAFTYTPALNYHGTDSFTYTVSDGKGGSDEGLVALTVTSVNDAPVAVDDAYSTAEDTLLTVALPGVRTNDSDVDNPQDANILTVTVLVAPLHGALALAANGSFTYDPADNYHGPDSFTYTVSDGVGGSDEGLVALTVTSVNDAPVAVDDAYSTAEDTLLTVALPGELTNDSDVDNPQDANILTVTVLVAPLHGALALAANGSFTYDPADDYFGPDSFTYTLSDGVEGTDEGSVAITVTSVNDPPTFTAGPNLVALNSNSGVTVNRAWATNVIDGPENETDELQFVVESITVVPVGTAMFTSTGAPKVNPDGNIVFSLMGMSHGIATVTLHLQDLGSTANLGDDNTSDSVTFTISVYQPFTWGDLSGDNRAGIVDAYLMLKNSFVTTESIAFPGYTPKENFPEYYGDINFISNITPRAPRAGDVAVNPDPSAPHKIDYMDACEVLKLLSRNITKFEVDTDGNGKGPEASPADIIPAKTSQRAQTLAEARNLTTSFDEQTDKLLFSVDNGEGIQGLRIALTYDPAKIDLVDELIKLEAKGGIFDYDNSTPGKLMVVAALAKPMSSGSQALFSVVINKLQPNAAASIQFDSELSELNGGQIPLNLPVEESATAVQGWMMY